MQRPGVAAEKCVNDSSHGLLRWVADTPRRVGHSPSNCVLISRAGGICEELEGSEARVGTGHPDGHATEMRCQERGTWCPQARTAAGGPRWHPLGGDSVGAASKDKGLWPEGGGGICTNSTSLGPAIGEADVGGDPECQGRELWIHSAGLQVQTAPWVRVKTDSPKTPPAAGLAPQAPRPGPMSPCEPPHRPGTCGLSSHKSQFKKTQDINRFLFFFFL